MGLFDFFRFQGSKNEIDEMIETINTHTSTCRSVPIRSDIIEAIREVPRKKFGGLYYDGSQQIGHGQTISQPFIVAMMTDLLQPRKNHRILEVGTGSGYQAAILSKLVEEVYTVEKIRPLAEKTSELLSGKYLNIHCKVADGFYGWKEHSPYDGIVVTAGAPGIPGPLAQQLKPGGKLIIPIMNNADFEGVEIIESWRKVAGVDAQLMVVDKKEYGKDEEKRLPPADDNPKVDFKSEKSTKQCVIRVFDKFLYEIKPQFGVRFVPLTKY
jgi:protein-L-isoaspartate(D-aspartate) O-methyltransferase